MILEPRISKYFFLAKNYLKHHVLVLLLSWQRKGYQEKRFYQKEIIVVALYMLHAKNHIKKSSQIEKITAKTKSI